MVAPDAGDPNSAGGLAGGVTGAIGATCGEEGNDGEGDWVNGTFVPQATSAVPMKRATAARRISIEGCMALIGTQSEPDVPPVAFFYLKGLA